MKPTFLPTLIPFTKEAQSVLALNPEAYDGYWARKTPWISETGEVYDQRLALGDDRDAQPLRATEWNGTNQYAWIPVDPVTEFPFTLFGWARTTVEAESYLLSLAGSSSSNIRITFAPQRLTNTARLVRGNTTGFVTDIAVGNLLNEWKSYVLIFQSSTAVDLYIDGALVQSLTGLDAVNLGTVFNRFGVASLHATIPSSYFNGRSMHCGFLRRAATLADAQAFHTTGIIPDAEVLLPLDGNSTTVAHNIGSSAAHWLDEPRRNLWTYTEDMTNAVWPLTNLEPITGNANSGFSVVPNTTLGQHRIYRSLTGPVRHVNSIDAKPNGYNFLSLGYGGGLDGSEIIFNLTTGEITGSRAGYTATATFTQDGWLRCSLSRTGSGDVNTGRGFIVRSSANVNDYSGDGTSGVLMRRPQFESDTIITPYQPVLRTGIDYPEATIVNGAAGMLYTGRDVPFSRQNEVGYSTRRNLFLSTEDIQNAYWVKANSAATSANNWQIASGISVNVASGGLFTAIGSSQIRSALVVVENTTYTVQVEIKTNSFSHLQLRSSNVTTLSGDEPKAVRVNMADGSLSSIDSDSTADIEVLPDGWIRVALTHTPSAGDRYFGIWLWNDTSFTTNGTESVQIRNWQLNVGDPTPYQRIGANPGANVLIPALLSDPTKSAATDPLTFSGEVPRNGQLEQANCFTFDGSDDRVAVDLSQWAGPELVTNGDFSNGSAGWTGMTSAVTPSGWTFTANEIQGVSASGGYRNVGVWESNKSYLCSITISNMTVGGISFAIDNGGFGQIFATNGTFLQVLHTGSSSGEIGFLRRNTNFTGTIDSISVRELPTIEHDGTSLLTYRSQGDGFTGTAGTAYNIRIGDVEHIPCSEGHGSVLHGTKLNQAYTVVNGQFSNWTANKQNVYHYNTAQGYGLEEGDVPTIDPLDLPGLKVYLDPADTTRMWRDAAGTNPVTAPGQEILRITDKSDQVTFVQNTPGQGPVWGRHPVSGIRNQLAWSEDITNAVWLKGVNTTVQVGVAAGPTGANNANRVAMPTGIGTSLQQPISVTSGVSYVFSLWIKTNNAGNEADIGVTTTSGAALTSAANIEATANWQRVSFTHTAASTGTLWFGVDNRNNATAIDILIADLQVESGTSPTPYQRVTNRFDITETGVPSLYYFSGNGVNQRWSSNAPVNFSGTDKVTVWAGLRKLSDAARGMVIELGNASNGGFTLDAPVAPTGNRYRFQSTGTSLAAAGTNSFNAPHTGAILGRANITLDVCELWVNGNLEATSSSDQGSGNYGNHTVHVFSRGGSSLFFNGLCYSLIIAGDNYDTATVTEVDKISRSKSGLVWYKDTYIPASQTNPGFDVLGNPLTNPPVVGLNGAESRINFSPVANSWPTGISIPGADIPMYEFDGNAGDINLGIDTAKREGSFHLRND